MTYFKVFSIIAAVLMAAVVVAQQNPQGAPAGAVGPLKASQTLRSAGGWQVGSYKFVSVPSGGSVWTNYECNGNTVPTSCSCLGDSRLTLISSIPWPPTNPTGCWCRWYNGAGQTQNKNVRVFAYCSF